MTKSSPNPVDKDADQSLAKSEYTAARIAIFADVVSTFGDFLATVADALALEEIKAADLLDQQEKQNQEDKMASMQQQIDRLSEQVNQLTRNPPAKR